MLVSHSHGIATIVATLTACLLNAGSVIAANAPTTVSQVTLYQGADREKILIEGAKKEAAFTLYGSHTWYRTMAKEFEKKYPFIMVVSFCPDGIASIR